MLPVDRIAAELIGCTKSALHRERPVAVEWPLLKMPRTLALQDDKCQVPAAAVIGLQNLTGWSQPRPAIQTAPCWQQSSTSSLWPNGWQRPLQYLSSILRGFRLIPRRSRLMHKSRDRSGQLDILCIR